MSIRGLCKRVSSLGFTLMEQGYALDAQAHAVSDLEGRVKALSWARDRSVALTLPAMPRVDDYLGLIREREYSFLMRDGAAIQILYQYHGKDLVKHRLQYWPCPFDAEAILGDIERPFIDMLEGFFLQDVRSETILRGLLRFDYAPEDAGSFHPASHLTMTGTGCRIPVHAPLNFDTFMRFVLENFYLDAWSNKKVRAHFAFRQEARSLRAMEEERIHLAWHYL